MAEQATSVTPIGNVDPEAGAQATGLGPSTRSTADAAKVTTAPAGPVASPPAAAGTVSAGTVVSTTCTVNEALPELPAASSAVHDTVVVPTGKVEPDAGEQVTATPPASTTSLATTVKATTAPAGPVASTVRSLDGSTTGALVSTTFTVKLAVPVNSVLSVAEQLTVVEPSANVEPDTGAHATVRLTPAASTAVAWYVTTAPSGPAASADTTAEGTAIAGTDRAAFGLAGSDACATVTAVAARGSNVGVWRPVRPRLSVHDAERDDRHVARREGEGDVGRACIRVPAGRRGEFRLVDGGQHLGVHLRAEHAGVRAGRAVDPVDDQLEGRVRGYRREHRPEVVPAATLPEFVTCQLTSVTSGWLMNVGLMNVGLMNVGFRYVVLMNVGLMNVGLMNVGLMNVGLMNVGLMNVGLMNVGLMNVGLMNVGFA